MYFDMKKNNLDFIAFDFETAKGNLPCQLGLAVVKNGEITDSKSYLIQPPNNEYLSNKIVVHNIWPDQTENAPLFPEVWEEVQHLFENNTLVAHKAISVDYRILKTAAEEYGIDISNVNVPYCTCEINEGKSLADCCRDYGIDLNNHHDAAADAIACAQLFIKAHTTGVIPVTRTERKPFDFAKNGKIQKWLTIYYDFISTPDLFRTELPPKPVFNKPSQLGILEDKIVCFLGKFEEQKTIREIKKKLGANAVSRPSKKTHLVVLGSDPNQNNYDHLQMLKHDGYFIPVINESEFVALVETNESDLNLSLPIKNVNITYDYIFNCPILEKVTKMSTDVLTHALGGKEIYIRTTHGNLDALAQCLGNIGASVSYTLSDDTDYIWLNSECVKDLKTGVKDDLINEVEEFYNSYNSPKFLYKFLMEEDVLNFIERRAKEINDEYSLDLYNRFMDDAIAEVEESIKSTYEFEEDKNYIKVNGVYVLKLADGRAWVPSRQLRK